MQKSLYVGLVLSAFFVTGANAQSFNPGYSSSWWAQIGLTSSIETTANGANGFKIGIVDTGIIATNPEVTGRVSSVSSCSALSFKCSNGVTDDNGHGTATASIAAGSTSTGGLMSGVAPKATIIAEKVLNASGSGYDTDVANGIINAAKAGAQVINLSLTYIPTAAIVNAMNYAASLGAIIVQAGGNSSASLNGGANTLGLSAAALARLVFVGSVSSKNALSYFSNMPGSGSVVVGSTKTSYSSLWLMAPGENIVAPGIMYGSGAYAYWTGTSMSTPEVAGALALLETTWPVLMRNGTATSVLFQTASDLGTKGIDTTYGNGLMNVTKAFQPIGTLTVTQSNGKSLAVSSLTGSMLSSGALGSLAAIKNALTSYTSFDSFQRNFIVNLSGLIATKPATAASVVAGAQAPTVSSASSKFADGSAFAFAYAEPESISGTPHSATMAQPEGAAWFAEFSGTDGTTLAGGHGFPASISFADTLWGFDSKAADEARAIGVSGALLKLADGGDFAAYGHRIGSATRVAFSFSDTQNNTNGLGGNNWQTPAATAFGTGITEQLADFGEGAGWTAGVTVGYLSETNALLGTAYDSNGLVSLGGQHHSTSVGLSSAFDLSANTGLLFDSSLVRTDGGAIDNSLISSTTPLLARSYGVSLVERDAFRKDDRLTLSLRKPLRVISGSANMAMTGVDADGYASTSTMRVGLTPSGSETNFGLNYSAPLRENVDFTAMTSFSQDAENVHGATAASVHIGFNIKF
jgi:hypothetical protein